jgi:hypothetical protein
MQFKPLPTEELNKRYADIFNKFAGREIELVSSKNGWLTPALLDAVANELAKDIADKTGRYTLFVIEGNQTPGRLPGGTAPVFVNKDADGKYRIKQIGMKP